MSAKDLLTFGTIHSLLGAFPALLQPMHDYIGATDVMAAVSGESCPKKTILLIRLTRKKLPRTPQSDEGMLRAGLKVSVPLRAQVTSCAAVP